VTRASSSDPSGTCAFCGRPLDGHDPNFRFRFPDAVVGLLEAGLDESEIEGDQNKDVVIMVRDAQFVRVLLQVRLTEGLHVTFGTWLEVGFDTLEKAAEIWWTPKYKDLVLSGSLANAVPPWGDELLGAPATATVLNADHSPYVTSSGHPMLSKVLQDVWPSDVILSALPHVAVAGREARAEACTGSEVAASDAFLSSVRHA
jgi:hypothetical protein